MPISPLTSTGQGPGHGASPPRDKCLKAILVPSVPCRTLHSGVGCGACPQPWWCPAGGSGAGLEPGTLSGLPVPAAAASDELPGRSSPPAERGSGRTRSAGPALPGGPIRPPIQKDSGGFVPSHTGKDLFVSQCMFLPPFLYFRFFPASQEPSEPAAARGRQSGWARLGSALPAAERALLPGAAPGHRPGLRRDFALRICSHGPHSPRKSPEGESRPPPSSAGLGRVSGHRKSHVSSSARRAQCPCGVPTRTTGGPRRGGFWEPQSRVVQGTCT